MKESAAVLTTRTSTNPNMTTAVLAETLAEYAVAGVCPDVCRMYL
jgi:hypothetical protein